MDGHVKVLAWLNLAFGAAGVAIGFLILAGGAVLAEIVENVAYESGVPVVAIHVIAIIIVSVVVVFSLPCLILGYGLLNLRPWARILGIVLAALNLLNVPLGTIVSLYALWVLLKPETEALFRAQTAMTTTSY